MAVRVRHAMVAAQPVRSPSEPTAPAPSPASEAPPGRPPTVLLVRNPETRLLLKGLLLLFRYPVLLEAERPDDLAQLPRTRPTTLLLLDADTESGDWAADVRAVLEEHPDLSPILLTSVSSPETSARAAQTGIEAVLIRPFTIREFGRILETVRAGSPPTLAGPSRATAEAPRQR